MGGGVAAVGLAGGAELYVSLMPFLLRGVNLLGVNSAATRRDKRLAHLEAYCQRPASTAS